MRQAIPRAICQHADGGRVTAFSSRSKVTALRQFHLPSCVCVRAREQGPEGRGGEGRPGRCAANKRAYVGPQRRPGHGVAATKERVLAGSRRGGFCRRYCSRPARAGRSPRSVLARLGADPVAWRHHLLQIAPIPVIATSTRAQFYKHSHLAPA